MKLGFVGADHEVTGSCHYLEACGKQILIDCGMEQGKDIYVNQERNFMWQWMRKPLQSESVSRETTAVPVVMQAAMQ